MTYELHFVAINGVQPNIPQNVEENLILQPQAHDKQDHAGKSAASQPDKITGKNIIKA